MARFNVMKVIMMITLIISVAAVDGSGGIGEEIFSKECAVYCSLKCTFFSGKARALCIVLCMLGCKRPPQSQSVVNCTSTCAESTCSKYYNSGNS